MVKPTITTLARVLPVLALFSCAPKANIVVEMPAPKKETPAEPAVVETLPEPAPPNDGFRMPDLFVLPDDSEFRSTSPAPPTSANPGTGAVIARPHGPPSRPKAED